MKYKVAVLGPIPRDHITTHHGEVIEKYGCAMHPTIGLSRLLGEEGSVIPVSHVRKVDDRPIKEILGRCPNIQTDFIRSEADQGDVIRLKFLDQNRRVEKQTGFMNPIVPKDFEALRDCDVFVCVPISDYEVPLETLKWIKANTDALIIFDAHGPTNTIDVFGNRHNRFWMDRDSWLPYIDVLKMNLEESHFSWFEKEYDEEDMGRIDEHDTSHLPEFGEHALKHGLKALIVTLDEQGSVLFQMEDGAMKQEVIPAIRVEHVVDTTGCGDSFAGGLGFGLLENTADFERAIRYANALGAQRTQGKTWDVFKERSETDRMIAEFYDRV